MVDDLTRTTLFSRFGALLLVLGFIVGVAPAARAQEPERTAPTQADAPPSVYIVSVARAPELEPVSARVGAAARAALRRVEGVDWQTPDQRFLGYDQAVAERLLRARTRLNAGRDAYTNLQMADAIGELAGAVEDFDAAAVAVEDPTDLGQALLLLGASYQLEGRDRDAARVFRRLHTQMRGVAPDPNEFNPQVVQKFQAAAPPDATAGTASVTVGSDPPGAIVYVDFVPRGLTPMTVGGLVSGQHIVRVTRAGATPFVQPVELRRGGTGSVNAFMEDNAATPGLHDAFASIADASVERLDRNGPIAAIANSLELQKIGVLRVAEGTTDGQVELELLLFDVASGRRLLRGAGEVTTEGSALELGVQRLVAGGLEAGLRAQQTDDHERIPARRDPIVTAPPPGHGGGGSVLGKWWFWSAVGGVVVIGAVVAIILATGGGTPLGQDPGGQVILQF